MYIHAHVGFAGGVWEAYGACGLFVHMLHRICVCDIQNEERPL